MNENQLWNREQIAQALRSAHQDFAQTIEKLPAKDFTYSWEQKWTPGQQLVHITQSVSPVVLALRLPRFVTKLMFGTANRPSKPYANVVTKYQKALKGLTAAAPKQFQPKAVPFSAQSKVINSYNKKVEALAKQVLQTSESDLDANVLPHPLVGKLTFREMLCFTVYHVQHHHRITKEILANIPLN